VQKQAQKPPLKICSVSRALGDLEMGVSLVEMKIVFLQKNLKLAAGS
jgi:hypothetical protein